MINTDQKSCFDEAGKEINCKGSGQDGAFEQIRQATSDRFEIIKDVVRDKWTGLFWHKNANLSEFPLTWSEAFDFVREINHSRLSGRSDWKLPARSQLFSLISHRCINPALPEKHPFHDVFNGYYWTTTECARLPDQSWYIHMGGGRVFRGMKHGSYMVWPVAGFGLEAYSIENRFIPTGHSFHDRLTQRTWLINNGLDNDPVTWLEALAQIKRINEEKVAGYSDWRLPNIRELESLIDVAKHSPALAEGCLFHKIQDGYWSGTTSVYEPRYAWVLYTQDGAIGVGYKPQRDFFGLAVR